MADLQHSSRWLLYRPAGLAVLIIWFALVTGFAEVAVLLFRRVVLGNLIWVGSDLAWMAPVAYLAYAALPGVALVALAAVLPRLVTLRRVVAVLAFCAAGILLLLLLRNRIHIYVQAVLAAAVALELARQAENRSEGFTRLVLRTTPALAALLVCLGVALPLGRHVSERLALGRLPDPPSGAPNVLLIIWDTVREASLSLSGYERPTTPELERWAARGTVFDRAYATAPWTVGTHGSLFTGLSPQQLGLTWHAPLTSPALTLAEAFRERGYYPAGFVANLIATGRETGLARGFLHYDDFPVNRTTVLRHSLLGQLHHNSRNRGRIRFYPLKSARDISDRFLRWLPETGDRPFFAFLNYFDAHDPYFPRPDLEQQFRSGRRLLDRYEASIATLDQELGRLLGEVERRGLLRNTIVILASDHGETFGEKGLHQHGHSLYVPLLHVPLVVWRPDGAGAGMRVAQPVSLQDLAKTLLELTLGPEAPAFPGRSLAHVWIDPAGALAAFPPDTLLAGAPKGVHTPPHEPVSRGNMSSLVAGDLHYILNGDGVEELYDLASDPSEDFNLAAGDSYREMLEELRNSLRRRIPPAWWNAESAVAFREFRAPARRRPR